MIEKRLWRSGEWWSKTKTIMVVRTVHGKKEREPRWIDRRIVRLFGKW